MIVWLLNAHAPRGVDMTADVSASLLRTHQTFNDAAGRLREIIAQPGLWLRNTLGPPHPLSAVEVTLMQSASEDISACSRMFERMEASLPLFREALSEEAEGLVDRSVREIERASQLLNGATEALDRHDVPTFHQLVRLSLEHTREANILTTAARFAMEEGVEISDLMSEEASPDDLSGDHEHMGADLAKDLERLGY